MLHSKEGTNALQIKRMVFQDRASYQTVWYMCTRIRAALQAREFEHLMGIVEVDETLVGGKEKNNPLGNRNRHNTEEEYAPESVAHYVARALLKAKPTKR